MSLPDPHAQNPFLVHHLLERAARVHAGRPALKDPGTEVDYQGLSDRAATAARWLRARGVRRGDRVLLMLENGVEFVAALFGAMACGAIAVPISPRTPAARLDFILRDCEPSVVIARAGELPKQGEAADGGICEALIDEDPALLIYTSGSTGEAKGVLLSHRNVLTAAGSIQAYLGLRSDDVIFCGLPLSFDYGLYQPLLATQVGACTVLEPGMTFPGHVKRLLVQHGVTVFPGVPTAFEMLLRLEGFRESQLPSLRLMTNTGAALPLHTIEALRAAFPAARLYAMYGLTECKRASYLPPEELDRRPGSIGRGMPNEELWLADENGQRLPNGSRGELWIRGSHVMLGYWRRPEETDEVIRTDPATGLRCLRTGDVFWSDADGYLYFEGRRDDMIKSGGRKIFPREIEAAIEELTGVAEVSVVGIPDPVLGQIVKAYVVLLPGYGYEVHAILAHCRARLEPHQVPASIEIRLVLPHGENGKVDRLRLAAGQASPEKDLAELARAGGA